MNIDMIEGNLRDSLSGVLNSARRELPYKYADSAPWAAAP